ncbi:MAG TPA: stage II sporulation protein M [Gemmatimonadaceae bacterium]|nr:stage II sporulation protein M [Gemmatimonadaceae bacterium]
MPDRLAQTIDIETPELVVVSYTIAGVGSRIAAGLIDLGICIAALVAVIVLTLVVGGPTHLEPETRQRMSTAWATAIVVIVQFVILWGYYVFAEGLFDGRTIGKRALGLRAVRDGGYSLGFAASAVRNLMRFVDLQPFFMYFVGIIGVAVSKSGKRLGDLVAGTIVVREAMVHQPISRPEASRPTAQPVPATTLLTDAEYQLLDRWTARRASLDTERRGTLMKQVAARLQHALSDVDPRDVSGALARLLARERDARQRGAVSKGSTGASRERYAIVTTRSPRWIAFAARLAEAQRHGLRSFSETQVREFVEEYRSLSADLARLRTATRGESSDELFYLGRLVSGAHNLLYRDRRNTLREVLRFVAVDVPTEVRGSIVPIAIAAAFMFGPAVIAWTAVVRNPAVASSFIPTSMLDRAEEGVERAKRNSGYIPDPEVFRPVMASRIIANNVQVTFAAFAFGITAGIGTVALLIFNGISLGGVFGLYQSKGILELLVAFVGPHGVLELSAICIAAGGGLLIAAAMLVPGDRTRRRALVDNGRRAMRLVTASTLMLIVAGSLEGMVSPIPNWPLWQKLAVSGATFVVLVAYLSGGARGRRAQPSTDALRVSTTGDNLLELSPRFDLEVAVDDRGGHA